MENFSQFGQDDFIDKHVFKGKRDGVFVEIGANDGVTLSNTLFFERHRGWKGACIEPLPDQFAKLRGNRSCACVNACIAAKAGTMQFTIVSGQAHQLSALTDSMTPAHRARIESEVAATGGTIQTINVQAMTFADVVTAHGLGSIDYCSIDTEGSEFEILQTIDLDRFPITCFSIEENGNFRKIHALLKPKGYQLVEKLGVDLIYVSKPHASRMDKVGLMLRRNWIKRGARSLINRGLAVLRGSRST